METESIQPTTFLEIKNNLYQQQTWEQLIDLAADTLIDPELNGLDQVDSISMQSMVQQLKYETNTGLKTYINWIKGQNSEHELPELYNEQQLIFLTQVMPRIILFASSSKRFDTFSPQENKAFINTIESILSSLTEGTTSTINLYTLLCPPYNYQVAPYIKNVGDGSHINHINGSILPVIGERKLKQLFKVTEFIWQPLLANGVTIQHSIHMYDGSGDIDNTDLDIDVKEYYSDNYNELQQNLSSAAREVEEAIAKFQTNNNYSIRFNPLEKDGPEEPSVTLQIGKLKADLRNNTHMSVKTFYETLLLILQSKYVNGDELQDIINWTESVLSVSLDSIKFFAAQEKEYRHKQGIKLDESFASMALNEALLYIYVANQAADTRQVIWGAETTSNYLNGMLGIRHQQTNSSESNLLNSSVASIFLRPVNPSDPFSIFAIREPFNSIAMRLDQLKTTNLWKRKFNNSADEKALIINLLANGYLRLKLTIEEAKDLLSSYEGDYQNIERSIIIVDQEP